MGEDVAEALISTSGVIGNTNRDRCFAREVQKRSALLRYDDHLLKCLYTDDTQI